MIYSLIYLASYLFLLPFFIRILLRLHRISLGHPLSFFIIRFTQPFLAKLSLAIPPSLYLDKAALAFTFICIFLVNHLRFVSTAHPFFEVLLVLTALDWLNRFIVMYLALALLKIFISFMTLPPSLEAMIDAFSQPALAHIRELLRHFYLVHPALSKISALSIWIVFLVFAHLFVQQGILERLV